MAVGQAKGFVVFICCNKIKNRPVRRTAPSPHYPAPAAHYGEMPDNLTAVGR